MDDPNSNVEVSLRSTTIADKKKIYTWLAQSNLTREMLGAPNFPDCPVPTWQDFDKDYLDYYLDGSQLQNGCCFIILHHGVDVGQINYNPINEKTKTTELDIWLADRQFPGQGIGHIAIKILCQRLFAQMGCKRFLIEPSARNQNAVRAYKKAGFKVVSTIPEDFELDDKDSIVMEMHFPQ